MTALNTASN